MFAAAPLPTAARRRSAVPIRRSTRPRIPPVGRGNSAAMARISCYLKRLRALGRRAVSIVDLGCGNGALAIAAARKARMLGFVAILVRGCDRSVTNVRSAQRNARPAADPAIGYDFAAGDAASLPFEDGEADLLLVGERSIDAVERIRSRDGLTVKHR